MKKYKIGLLFIILISLFTLNVKANYAHRTREVSRYSTLGLRVVHVVFHAEGYSTRYTGKVTNMYIKDNWIIPNTVSNKQTWKSERPWGERANASVEIGVGIPSPWGGINILSETEIMQIDF